MTTNLGTIGRTTTESVALLLAHGHLSQRVDVVFGPFGDSHPLGLHRVEVQIATVDDVKSEPRPEENLKRTGSCVALGSNLVSAASTTGGEIDMSKRPSKAAQAAMEVTGAKRPARRKPVDVLVRLREIDPAYTDGPVNRFGAEIKKGKTAVSDLLEMLADADAEARSDAAEALGRIGDTKALASLRKLLKDPDGEVRTNAAVALIRIGDEKLFPEVVKALRHQDPRVVIGAAVALGRLADARVVPNLVEAFKTEDPEVGAAVAWALGQCGDAAALPWLLTALDQGFATANVCEALGRIGDAKAQPALIAAIDYASDDTRAYAARALGLVRQGGGRAGALADSKAIPALKAALNDRSRKVRLCAAISLYEMGEKLGGEAVVDALSATS